MSEVTLECGVRIAEDVLFRDLQGEAVVLHLRTGLFFGLDPVATRIWHLVDEHRSLRAVFVTVLEEYDVPEARCRQDLLGLVVALHEHGLVHLENPAATPAPAAPR